MYQVGQTIFAKQNWTVTAALLSDHKVYGDLKCEMYMLQGKRGSEAMLMRQVSKDGKVSPWTLARGIRSETVTVYV